jgi:FlaA1/EpsC-like NDP-sugar epimerase
MGLNNFFINKTVLVTGGCGTIGTELSRQLINLGVKELRIIDNSEDGVFNISQKYKTNQNVKVFLGGIRDEQRLKEVTKEVNIIIHAAALKHVHICELAPVEAVMTNIVGTQNLIKAAIHNRVEKCLLTSTDKAVNPTNVMGTSKLMAERLFTAANNYSAYGDTIFSSTRFGNVLGSRGSVIKVFNDQLSKRKDITITDKRMSRFIMTIQESVRLVLAACLLSKGGEIFVPKMKILKILDLASSMVSIFDLDKSDVKMKIVGAKGGEKLFEELMTEEETNRALELDDMFSILPAKGSLEREIQYNYDGDFKKCNAIGYDTKEGPFMNEKEIIKYILDNKVIKAKKLRSNK